jgi:hypothetical protein
MTVAAPASAPARDDAAEYPLITDLEASDATYRGLLSQYESLSGQYIDDKAMGNTADLTQKEQMMSQLVVSMGEELEKMNGILNSAYNDGMTNQTLSAKASNALGMQATLIEMRMKQYQDARNSLARVVGEERSSHSSTMRSRLIYYVYFIFAAALCASIVYVMIGGSLPFALLIVLLVLGLFIGWEFYKSWLARIGTNISLGAPNVTGVFRIVT